MIGLIILREPIIKLLFERGAFDQEATRLTAEALLFYALGLCAFSGVRIVAPTFYALQDTKTPVKMAVISLIVNIAAGIALMGPMRHGGLALATSIGSAVNLTLLIYALRKRIGRIDGHEIIRSLVRSAVSAAVMGVAVGFVALWCVPKCVGSTWYLVVCVFGSILLGILIYGACAVLLRSQELGAMVGIISGSFRKKDGVS